MKRRFQGFKRLLAGVLTLSLLSVGALAAEGPPASYTSSTGIKLTVSETPYSGVGDGVYQSLAGMEGSKEGLYDADGNLLCILDPATIDRIGNFRFGLVPAKIFDPNTGEEGYGYIDKYGKVVIAPKYSSCSGFTKDGLAMVMNEQYQYGYIDASGREVVPCQYQNAIDFSGGYAVVSKSQNSGNTSETSLEVINTTGAVVWKSPVTISDGIGGKFIVPDYTFAWLDGQQIVDGICAVQGRDEETGMYYPVLVNLNDGSVREIKALAYEDYDDQPLYLGNDRFRYIKNDRAAVLDLEGNVVIPYGSEYNKCTFWGFVEVEGGIADLNGNLVFSVNPSGTDTWTNIWFDNSEGVMIGRWPGVSGHDYLISPAEGSTDPDPEPEPEPAEDKPSSWAAEQVDAAIAAGLVPESLQSKYTQTATRAEFCALAVELYETAKGAEITERATFTDTDDVNVQKMAGLGVVGGVGDGKFNPGGQLTREQAATILARLAEAMGQPLPTSDPTFADNGSVSGWAKEAVGQMQASGVMSGTSNNNFSPLQPYTREQCMMTTLRLFEMLQ